MTSYTNSYKEYQEFKDWFKKDVEVDVGNLVKIHEAIQKTDQELGRK